MKKSEPPERDATPAEMKALGHPLRWRILRTTLDKAMTNKEIAVRLGRDPGTTLYHVRKLVEQGFIAAQPSRASGKRGAHEIPYRATGKSWRIRVKPSAGNTAAILDAVREEVGEMGDDGVVSTMRLGVKLLPDDLAELRKRISELGDEFQKRGDPAGEPVGLLAVVHRRRP